MPTLGAALPRYLFDNAGDQTPDRFAALEHYYDRQTQARLAAVGVSAGWRCLEIGGGGGSIARWLAAMVGPAGSVLATDIDPRRMDGDDEPGPANLEICQHDISTDDLPAASFDLVHARLVLIHVPERLDALTRIKRALKPGGVLVLDEFDTTYLPVLAAPDDASAALFSKVVEALHHTLEINGMQQRWGVNAYTALRDAGYVDLGHSGYSTVWRGGSPGADLHRANVTQVGEVMVDKGLVTESEITDFLKLLDDPALAISSYLMLTTWGRTP